MKKYLGYLGAFYLGGSISYFIGLGVEDWKFWVIIIPTFLMFSADKELNK